MIKVDREFYNVDETSNIFGGTVSDIWHLIELGKLDASFRTSLCGASFDMRNSKINIHDVINHTHTLLISFRDARRIASFGEVMIDSALIYLNEPYEVVGVDIDGNEMTYLDDKEIASLTSDQFLLKKEHVVITQLSIDRYKERYIESAYKLNEKLVATKQLNTRTENNYLRLIFTLANSIKGFNPRKPYEAAKLIIDETGINISQQTISDYISKAYEIESKNRE